jgi:hypothetical protein
MAHRTHAVHHVRGRIRLKVPRAKGNSQILSEVKDAISGLEGVRRVEANPGTGGLVVHYDPALHAGFHEQLAQHGTSAGAFELAPPELSEVDELAKKIEAEAEFLAEHSETARQIVNSFKALDQSIKRATGNAVDLKVLLPLGLAIYSFVEVGLEASTPLWVTLGIFSFNSFVQLHGSPPNVSTQQVLVNTTEQAPAGSSDRK